MDLPYEARIQVSYEASGELADTIAEHAGHIAAETLATTLQATALKGREFETEVDGAALRFAIETKL